MIAMAQGGSVHGHHFQSLSFAMSLRQGPELLGNPSVTALLQGLFERNKYR